MTEERREYWRNYRALNQDKVRAQRRAWYHRHAAERAAYMVGWRKRQREHRRSYREKNKERDNAKARDRYKRNPELFRTRRKEWRSKNPAKERQIDLKQYRQNPNRRIKSLSSSRIRTLLKKFGFSKQRTSTVNFIGCDIPFLRAYLEARFLPGMTWENHGKGEGKWHIDHRIPCASFDLRDPDQKRLAFHYSNLQPLWSHDNHAKSDKLPAPHQAELL